MVAIIPITATVVVLLTPWVMYEPTIMIKEAMPKLAIIGEKPCRILGIKKL